MANVWEHIQLNSFSGADASASAAVSKESQSLKSAKPRVKSETDKRIDCKNAEFIICQRGIKVSVLLLRELNIYQKVINYFTISVPQIGGYIKKVYNHKNCSNSQIILPRFGMIDFIEKHLKNYKICNNIKSGLIPTTPFKWAGSFTNNQPIIAEHIMSKYFNKENADNGRAGLILNLEAGQGKSYLASGLIEKIQRKTLVICHTESILNQWVQVLKAAYSKNTIGQYFGKVKEDGDIVVAIINSLLADKLQNGAGEVKPAEFFQSFGYVIIDEIHLFSSHTRKNIYNVCQRKYMLGLSATPDENKDGLDAVNTWHCGPILNAADLDGYSVEDIPFKGNISVIKYYGNPDYTQILTVESTELINHSGMINQICEDPYRMKMVIAAILELCDAGKNIFVFADRRDYLKRIKSHESLNRPDIVIMDLMGGSTAEEMDTAKKTATVILTTYQFMGTGVSIPRMDALILATPRKTKSRQYINRIFRLGSDYTSVRKIIDIVDWCTHMKAQYYHRKKYYDEKQYPIETKSIKWADITL
jgi:superfamily II DNA or RNA helicase